MLNQIIEQLDELGADKLDRVLVVDSNGHALPTVMAYKGDELLTLNKELMGLFLEGLAPYADSVSNIDHNSYYLTRLNLNDASIHNTASSILFTKHCPISIMDTLCMADSLGAKRLLVDFEGADDACESLGWVFKNQDDNTAETTNSNERDQIKTAISQLIDELAPGWMEEEGSTGSLGLDLTTGEYKLSRTIYTKKEESELHERELSKVALSGDSIANSKMIAELLPNHTLVAHYVEDGATFCEGVDLFDMTTNKRTTLNESDDHHKMISKITLEVLAELSEGWARPSDGYGTVEIYTDNGHIEINHYVSFIEEEKQESLGFIRTEFAHHLPEPENQNNHPTPSL